MILSYASFHSTGLAFMNEGYHIAQNVEGKKTFALVFFGSRLSTTKHLKFLLYYKEIFFSSVLSLRLQRSGATPSFVSKL